MRMRTKAAMWAEYDAAAEWCARRGFAGEIGDPLPDMGGDTHDAINADPVAFARRVRETVYMLAREAPWKLGMGWYSDVVRMARRAGTQRGGQNGTIHR